MISFKRSVLLVLMASMMAGSAGAFETESRRLRRGLTYYESYTEPAQQSGNDDGKSKTNGRPEGVGKPASVGNGYGQTKTKSAAEPDGTDKPAMSGTPGGSHQDDQGSPDDDDKEKEAYGLMRKAMKVANHCGSLKRKALAEVLENKEKEKDAKEMPDEEKEKKTKELKERSDKALRKANKLAACEKVSIDVATSADEAATNGMFCGIMKRVDELKPCMDLVKEEGDEGVDEDTDEDEDEDTVEKTERIRKMLQLRKSIGKRAEKVKRTLAKQTHVMEAIENETDMSDEQKASEKKKIQGEGNKGLGKLDKLDKCLKQLERRASDEAGDDETPVDATAERMDYEECMEALEADDDESVESAEPDESAEEGTPEGDKGLRKALGMAKKAEDEESKSHKRMEKMEVLGEGLQDDPELTEDEKEVMRGDLKQQVEKEKAKAKKLGGCVVDMTEAAMDIVKAMRKGGYEAVMEKPSYKKCKMVLEEVTDEPYEATDPADGPNMTIEKKKKMTEGAKKALKLLGGLDEKTGKYLEKAMMYQKDSDELDDDDVVSVTSEEVREKIKKTLQAKKDKARNLADECVGCEAQMARQARRLMGGDDENDAEDYIQEYQMCSAIVLRADEY